MTSDYNGEPLPVAVRRMAERSAMSRKVGALREAAIAEFGPVAVAPGAFARCRDVREHDHFTGTFQWSKRSLLIVDLMLHLRGKGDRSLVLTAITTEIGRKTGCMVGERVVRGMDPEADPVATMKRLRMELTLGR